MIGTVVTIVEKITPAVASTRFVIGNFEANTFPTTFASSPPAFEPSLFHSPPCTPVLAGGAYVVGRRLNIREIGANC